MRQDIFTIDHFLSQEECRSFIEKSERIGYEQAAIETADGPRLLKVIRNNSRLFCTDPQMSAILWQRIKPYVPIRIGDSPAVGLNELFRYYRYEPGQHFKKHIDQPFIRNGVEASFYTVLIYLNDNYRGGETSFEKTVIYPKTGTALLFRHDLLHSGNEVIAGTKYVIRTDIMFRVSERSSEPALPLLRKS